MGCRRLILCVILLVGCARGATVKVEDPPPTRADINFDLLPSLLAGIQGGNVVLYEGLPSQFWEPQLREDELRKKRTIRIHGHPVYEEPLTLDEADGQQLTALFSKANSFQKFRENKNCGGYQPEFCLEWTFADQTTDALISLECGEVEIFGPKGGLHCNFSDEASKKLAQLLSHYTKNRPRPASNP